jgi:hypothetical protein
MKILNTKIISTVKIIRFYSKFVYRVVNVVLKDNYFQLSLKSKPEAEGNKINYRFIYLKRQIQIPNSKKLYLKITHSEHHSKVVEYFRNKKTLELITKTFY